MRIQFPGSESLYTDKKQKNNRTSYQLNTIFDTTIGVVELAMLLFIAVTIRYYERKFIEDEDSNKEIKLIKKIIKERFTAPTLGTLLEVTRKCVHLINDKDKNVPRQLARMKQSMVVDIELGNIANLLNDWAIIFHKVKPDTYKSIIILQPSRKLSLLKDIVPKLIEYRNDAKHIKDMVYIIEEMFEEKEKLALGNWHEGLNHLLVAFGPIFEHDFVRRSIETVNDSAAKNIEDKHHNLSLIFKVITYTKGDKKESEEIVSFEEFEEYTQTTLYECILNGQDQNIIVDLFPFIVIENDNLYFYKGTKAKGYQYMSLANDKVHLVRTKRKFNYSVFKIGSQGDRQAAFWTEVSPSTNKKNKIKANIPPTDDLVKFVGRKNQINKITEEILEIPNQNGILFGPGGVGKTALMLELSRDLYEEDDVKNVHFKNIIWMSAKSNYYNPFLNTIEEKTRGFESLDNVLTVLLRFFEFENIEEYSLDEKKPLVLELFEEHQVLIVLDNFETVPKNESHKIIRFFEIDVKKYLKKQPHNCKIILTSREQIPCGFHQLKLQGLGFRESKQLMTSLFKQYKSSTSELTEELIKEIHETSSGIPIIIKHCMAQIFEFNIPVNDVINNLSSAVNEPIKFSFSEILNILKKDDVQLKILLLLDLINYPLLIRQISDILEIEEKEIGSKIPNLINFQILERVNTGKDEKFAISDNVKLFAKNLMKNNFKIVFNIRKQIANNFTVDKRLEYSSDEQTTLEIFNEYISNEVFLDAESFIIKELEANPHSILLKLHYAKFLKDQRKQNNKALEIGENLVKQSNKHPIILQFVISCFTSLDTPNYEQASIYAKELEENLIDDDIKLSLAQYYVGWSTTMKNMPRCLDPIQEIKRQSQYKQLANKAIIFLDDLNINNIDHSICHLLAQTYFNIWENEKALQMINRAIKLLENDPTYIPHYKKLKKLIMKKINYI